MKDGKTKDWMATSLRREQYNGLRLMATKDTRTVAQMLYLILRKGGVPELTDEELETKLKKLKNVVMEVEAR